jgi:hypothetical protein
MKSPIFVRPFSEKEREALEAGLRSKDAFTLRRSQMILASSRGEEAPQIASNLGCGQQTVVRDAIHDFNARGLEALVAKSSRPLRTREALDEEGVEPLRELLLHCSPREFGHDTVASGPSRWWRRLPLRRGSRKGGSGGRPSELCFHAFSE